MMKKILKFFDKLEDKIRVFLSHYPIIYAMIGGSTIVLFWRGIWEMGDFLFGKEPVSILISLLLAILIMLLTGLFVSFFIGDRIILSGLKHEKKLTEKTEAEIRSELDITTQINIKLEQIEKKLAKLEKKIDEIV